MPQAIPTPESLSAPEAAYGRWPPSVDFHGGRELDWNEIEIALHALDTIGVKVEVIGRSAVDNVNSEKLGDVFESIRADIEEQVGHLKSLLGLTEEVHS